MITKYLSHLKARIIFFYQELKSLDEIPFRFINGDFEDQRVKVRAPRRNHVRIEDLKPKRDLD